MQQQEDSRQGERRASDAEMDRSTHASRSEPQNKKDTPADGQLLEEMRNGREAERLDRSTIKERGTHRGRDTETDRQEHYSDRQTGKWIDR